MRSLPPQIITPERFSSIIHSIPRDADALSLSLNGVYYVCAREESGTYKGEPYTKPEHIQIAAKGKRFWIERIEQTLRFMVDPAGGFQRAPLTEQDVLPELEGYFSDLENHLASIRQKQQPATSTKPIVAARDVRAFIQAVLPWCDENQRKGVQDAAELALTSPQRYLQANREQLASRGIAEPIRHLYAIALVDAMQRIGAVAEVDWRADGETVFWHISRIAQQLGVNVQAAASAAALPTREVLQRLGRDLAAQGHLLAAIDIGSDSYVLCIVPSAAYDKIAALAKKAGIKTSRF